MIKVPKNLIQSMPVEELADWIIKNFPVYDIAVSAAEMLKNEGEEDKISISYAQLRRYFKVRGLATTSPFTAENRGRKPKSERAIAAAAERDELLENGYKR